MALSTESVSKPNVHKRIDALATRLRRRQLIGSREVALEVVRLLRDVVAGAKFSFFQQLVDHLEEVGRLLQEAGPKELVVTNMTRRICMLIREEYQTALSNHLDDTDNTGGNGGAGPSSSPNSPSDFASHTAGAAPTPALSRATSSFFPERRESGDILGRTTDGPLGSIFNLLGHSNATEGASRSALSAFGGLGGGGTATPGMGSPASSAAPSPIQSPESSQILQRPNPFANAADRNFASFNDDNAAANTPEEDDFSRRSFSLKPVFIEAIAELMDEVETTYRSVGEQAIEHIHSGEFIMTIGHSKTVEAFLKNAARKRKFTVICAETAPSFSGQKAAMAYSSAGIATILIPDSNIFALLPRCSKVLVGPHVILADGALLSIAGSLPLCLAANRMRVPVVAVGGMFKFSPIYWGEAADWGMRDLGSPEEVLPSTEECVRASSSLMGAMPPLGSEDDEDEDEAEEQEETEILNPYYDVVPADLVSLYISNLGGHPSSLLYRLLNDMYGSS
ncbi:GCD complex subunit gcd7 [Rhodotorula mucilaginosa]|uniref:Translation initiation factor eIF2B subunit beta n=1 Tax=Rhodotorula mucilaginosa TaxID=5537 RepID=A0A9P6W5W5_RHOMI|nr:GCD complex subunit gcd7 [Rhodotorula mucilaginosa]